MTNSPLKLLLFSDLHANTRAAEALARRAAEFDIVIGAGDFGNARRDLRVTIDVLKLIDRPTILVAGNNESTGELRDACLGWPSATVLHGNSVEISGVTFYGLGGGVPVTPFGDWSYDLTEEQAGSLLAACPARSVLISHSPPKGVVDVSSQGQELGEHGGSRRHCADIAAFGRLRTYSRLCWAAGNAGRNSRGERRAKWRRMGA
ncbi:MAG: Ser/Thr protein phosphatase family protein [Capsulimonas sp.]|nr:Ser/Thr protein phosphatase family protein [Capsulimonas sp.]